MTYVVVTVNTQAQNRIVCVDGPFVDAAAAEDYKQALNADFLKRNLVKYKAQLEVVTQPR